MTETFEKAPTFPITRTLTDNTGRPLEATIIGRGVSSITVIRKSDGSRFEIPLGRLSPDDREYVASLPLFTAPLKAPIASPSSPSFPPAPKGSPALSFLTSKREEINKEVDEIDETLLIIDGYSVKGRTLRNKRNRLLE